MNKSYRYLTLCLILASSLGVADEKVFVSLRDFSKTEIKSQGFELTHPTTVHIQALGAGGDYGWSYKSDRLTAYGWIINAETRSPVWEMTSHNSSKSRDDRSSDETIQLDAGKYEVYFTAYSFMYHTWLTHVGVNIDHRRQPLFGSHEKKRRNFLSWFSGWWTDDIAEAWERRSPQWGIDLSMETGGNGTVPTFTPPLPQRDVVLSLKEVGENQYMRRAFTLSARTMLHVRAIGEGRPGSECNDCGWIVNARTRERVWEMRGANVEHAGGASKNMVASDDLTLDAGTYVVYFASDDSHSPVDWNDAPPYDPLNWGITLSIPEEDERAHFAETSVNDFKNIIVSITKVGDNETRTAGFVLKRDTRVRIYAIGERSNNRRRMSDYGMITDARTRARAWSMDVERTEHAGGASKNRFVDEIISLPKGSYLVTYVSDDSHAFNDWNSDPPFDQTNYGITVMGADDSFSPSAVGKYVEEKDPDIIAQIVEVGNNADRTERFSLKQTTRIRVYAIGEGQNREMIDYGWIEDAHSKSVVWEMTYSMTFHAGGGRKNRVVNTTIVLDKGDYLLRYRTDDSHAYGDWNVDQPDDPQYWGISLYRQTTPGPPPPPMPKVPPPNRYPDPRERSEE
jgi:hypothetical protein